MDSIYDIPSKSCDVDAVNQSPRRQRSWVALYALATAFLSVGMILLIVMQFVPQIETSFSEYVGYFNDNESVTQLCKVGCNSSDSNEIIASLATRLPLSERINDVYVNELHAMIQQGGPYISTGCSQIGPQSYSVQPISSHGKPILTGIEMQYGCSSSMVRYTYTVGYRATMAFYTPLGGSPISGSDYLLSTYAAPCVALMFVFYGIAFLLQCGALACAVRSPPVEGGVAERAASLHCGSDESPCGGCGDACCCDTTYSDCNYHGCSCCVCTPAGNINRLTAAIIAFQVVGIVVTVAYFGAASTGYVDHVVGERGQVFYTPMNGFYALLAVFLVVELVGMALVCAICAKKLW